MGITWIGTGRFGAPASFVPTDIAGLTLWLDADDVASFTFGTGSEVATWADRSPSGFDVSEATNRPSRSGTINGRSSVVFDGVNDQLTRASAPLNNSSGGAWTIFAVAKPSALSSVKALVDGDAAGIPANRVAQYLRHNGTALETLGFNGSAATTDGSGVTLSTGVTYVLRSVNTGSALEAFVDAVGNGSTGFAGSQAYIAGISLGIGVSVRAATGTYFAGEIAEVVAYNTALSAGNITSVETYLAAKWGVTL